MKPRILLASIVFAVGGLLATPAAASSPAQATAGERLWFGAAWYPEQWPEADWEKDLALMEAAGVSVVRIGEFAWSSLEPSEGNYDLNWMSRAIRAAERHHISVVIGTPTDTPPAWLTQKYPKVLRVDSDGKRAAHGGRRQFSISSPLYRQFCRDIVERLARRFGHDPDVVGWQIDNEYTESSYDGAARQMFAHWLREHYRDLGALNRVWTTTYWSQTYTDWSQVPLTANPGNPGLMLDTKRFISDTWRSYQENQRSILRGLIAPGQFVTTDVGGLGWSDNWDHYEIAKDLDLVSWNPYVGQGHLDFYRHAAISDYVRGWKRQNYWVMETQPGFVNWAPVNTALDRGEVRAMAWESVGHGADAVLFWQWRSALNGQEQYHGTLVGPDGNPEPLYEEFSSIGHEFAKASSVLSGTTPASDVAIITTYDSRWAIDFQPHSVLYDQLKVLLDYYRPLYDITHAVDIVDATAPLDRYKIVFAPQLNVIPEALAQHLADYVRHGGHLILGPRSGMKDQFNRLNVQRQPGPLASVLGGRVEQYYALDDTLNVSGAYGKGTASIWGEDLRPATPQTAVLLRYGENRTWLSGRAAAIGRDFGKGKIVYLGTLLDPDLMRNFVRAELASAQVAPWFAELPQDVEAMRRSGENKDVFVFINHGPASQTINLPQPMRDILHDRDGVRTVVLASQDVALLEMPHAH
jgi:beta-galactosidase